MDSKKVELVVRYALARAAHADTPWDRELGPIHLVKFVYLADLAFAERSGGVSFTGAEWRFHHYGPWSPAVHNVVRATAAEIAAQVITTSTKFENDAVRWAIQNLDDADEIERDAERDLPSPVVFAVRRSVKDFGHDTTGLLHYVYGTVPMLRAAPGELLDLSLAVGAHPTSRKGASAAPLTRRQEKKREEAHRALQARARAKLDEILAKRATVQPGRRPRYDAVFVEGQKWLDKLGGEVEEFDGEVEFDDAVWKDPWRSDPGA